ncbi:hypothetical protein AAC387_Pa08g0517 [Persea americana]
MHLHLLKIVPYPEAPLRHIPIDRPILRRLENSTAHNVQDMLGLRNCSDMVEGSIKQEGNDDELHFQNIKSILSLVTKDIGTENGTNWASLLRENGKFLSFAALQLPWLLELSGKDEYGQKMVADTKTQGKQYMSLRTQAMLSILSWLARNGIVGGENDTYLD